MNHVLHAIITVFILFEYCLFFAERYGFFVSSSGALKAPCPAPLHLAVKTAERDP